MSISLESDAFWCVSGNLDSHLSHRLEERLPKLIKIHFSHRGIHTGCYRTCCNPEGRQIFF